MVRLVLQRVLSASVTVNNEIVGQIGPGLLVLLGINTKDTPEIVNKYVEKLLKIRLWDEIEKPKIVPPLSSLTNPNEEEKKIEVITLPEPEPPKKRWNSCVLDRNYQILVVSQFTLYGTLKKGNKPDFHYAMEPVQAEKLYNGFVDKLKSLYKPECISTGKFGEYMKVQLENDGPVTIILDSADK